MLTRRIIRISAGAGLLAAAVGILGLAPAESRSQRAAAPIAPPTPDEAFAAFRAVRERVLAWNAEAPTGFACRGACVTLRYQGETVGRGLWIAQDATTDQTLDLAIRDAMLQAERRLPLPADATRSAVLRDLAAQMTIGLELAGELVPLAPEALSDATLLLSPGLEGVAVRLGTRLIARFPEHFVETGATAGHTIQLLASDVSGETALALLRLDELAAIQGLTFYRFKVTHLAQVRPGSEPEFLRRSGLHVEQQGLNSGALRTWAAALGSHLARAVDDRGELVGVWLPVPGKPDDGQPGAVSRGLAALALRRAIDHGKARSGTPEAVRRAFDALVRREEERLAENANLLDDPAAAALWAGALAGMEGEAPGRVLGAATRALDLGGEFTSLSPSLRAAAAWGLAKIADGEHPDRAIKARAITVSLLQEAEPGNIVGLMPFIGWAQIELARGEPSVPGAPLLRQTRALLWTNQLTPDDTGPEAADLAGGLVFSAGRVPLPSWHTARPVALAATMLGDPRLTPDDEVGAELMSLLASLRFLRQLTTDDSGTRMFRSPERAVGGVRAALWDQRMPIEATSITLITVIEAIESLEAVARRRAGR